MSDQQPPRSSRPGGPRRPGSSRARAGGSARAMPSVEEQERQARAAREPRGPGAARGGSEDRTTAIPTSSYEPTPTRAYPVYQDGAGQPAPAPHGARPAAGPPVGGSGGGPAGPGGPGGPGDGGRGAGRVPRRRSRASRIPRPLRLAATGLALVLVIVLGWGAGLMLWADSRIEHVDALSDAANTPGTTYLIAGSDGRDGESVADDGTEGQRTDTMMLLHKARNGNSYLVSLPRDTLVDIPGHGGYKLNAAYAFGGAPLLVETVEAFTGLTVDHYVEVGFDGVANVVDAVGTVNLCIDQDVDDEKSGLVMTEGCHDVGGDQALAFVRARYFDPTADLGRQGRQQQFVAALMDRMTDPGVILNPVTQVKVAGAGSDALTTSEGTGMIDVARMGLTARSAMNGGGSLTIPIEDQEYRTQNSGVAILTDDADVAEFFGAIEDGSAATATE